MYIALVIGCNIIMKTLETLNNAQFVSGSNLQFVWYCDLSTPTSVLIQDSKCKHKIYVSFKFCQQLLNKDCIEIDSYRYIEFLLFLLVI